MQSSYTVATKSNRWTSKGMKASLIKSNSSIVIIHGGSELTDKDLLGRCIVRKVEIPSQETPTLNDIWRWARNTWKSTHGVNVFEMNDSQFLFELSSMRDAEHVLPREWHLRKSKVVLEWWTPTTSCWPEEMKCSWAWIRLRGIPVNLWSQEVFKAIGDHCGGWIKTEETTLKNHLCWARIKVSEMKKRCRETTRWKVMFLVQNPHLVWNWGDCEECVASPRRWAWRTDG